MKTTIQKLYQERDPFKAVILLFLTLIIFSSGLFAIISRQPSSWFDEEIHYVRSVQIANGDIFRTRNQDNSQYGGMISESQNAFVERSFNSKLFNEDIQAIETSWLSDYSDLPYSNKSIYRVSVTATSYVPISYFPYVLVVWGNKLLKLDVAKEFLVMKIVGFLFSFTFLFLAVRTIPYAKIALLALATLPPYFLSMASVTADSYLFGVAPLFMAYSLKILTILIKKDSLSWGQISLLSFLGLLVTLAKPPACFLVALLLPLALFGKLKGSLTTAKALTLLASVVTFALITLGWLYVIRHVDSTKYFGSVANVSEQLHFIKTNPRGFIDILRFSLLNYNFFALQLGYADQPSYMAIPMFPSLVAGVGLVCSVFIEEAQELPGRKLVAWFDAIKVLLFVGITLFIFIILYLQYTAVAALTIDGVQPRYFLPFWLLLLSIRPRSVFSTKTSQIGIVLACLFPLFTYYFFLSLQL